jgi:hypothetical protein
MTQSTTEDESVAVVGKKSFQILLAAIKPSYETVMIVTDVVSECQGWTQK